MLKSHPSPIRISFLSKSHLHSLLLIWVAGICISQNRIWPWLLMRVLGGWFRQTPTSFSHNRICGELVLRIWFIFHFLLSTRFIFSRPYLLFVLPVFVIECQFRHINNNMTFAFIQYVEFGLFDYPGSMLCNFIKVIFCPLLRLHSMQHSYAFCN